MEQTVAPLKQTLSKLWSTVGVFLLLPVLAQSQIPGLTCEQLVRGNVQSYAYAATGDWRPTNGADLFSAFRANAPHYWKYVSLNKNLPPALLRAMSFNGIVMGDLHIKNIDFVERPFGQRKLELIDLDDGGLGSLFADFARGAIGVQISPYAAKDLKILWKAYLQGLEQKDFEAPKIIRKIEKKSEDDFLELQEKMLHKLTDGSRFKNDGELLPLEQMDPRTADVYKLSQNSFAHELEGSTILDRRFFVKATGGSQGTPRFWYLIEKNGKKDVIEFKTLAMPATAMFRRQMSQVDRITALIRRYRSGNPVGIYKAIDAGRYQFIVRTRVRSFLDLDPKKIETQDDIDDGKDVSIYMMYLTGLWHGAQAEGPALLQALKSEDGAFQNFAAFVNEYIRVMQHEQENRF